MKKFIFLIFVSSVFLNLTYAADTNMQESPINLNIEKEIRYIGDERISEIYKYTLTNTNDFPISVEIDPSTTLQKARKEVLGYHKEILNHRFPFIYGEASLMLIFLGPLEFLMPIAPMLDETAYHTFIYAEPLYRTIVAPIDYTKDITHDYQVISTVKKYRKALKKHKTGIIIEPKQNFTFEVIFSDEYNKVITFKIYSINDVNNIITITK